MKLTGLLGRYAISPKVSVLGLVANGWDQDIDRYYYIWVVKGPTETILVDTGVGLTVAADRKLKGYVNPIDVAARIGVKPNDVTKVVITHMHWDHVGGMEMMPKAYPKATFYVQKREYDFWTKHPVAKRKIFAGTADPLAYKIMQEMEGTPRLQLVNGDMNIGPGLDIMLGPGHTIGTQSLAVPTAKGTAVVASDCGHLARNFKEDTPSIQPAMNGLAAEARLRGTEVMLAAAGRSSGSTIAIT